MDKIRQLAELSVGRGCGFALVAVLAVIVGLSSQMSAALAAGGMLCLIGSVVLMLLGWQDQHCNHKRTELWLLLEPGDRPPGTVAERLVRSALREAHLSFAIQAAMLAAGLLTCSLALGLLQV